MGPVNRSSQRRSSQLTSDPNFLSEGYKYNIRKFSRNWYLYSMITLSLLPLSSLRQDPNVRTEWTGVSSGYCRSHQIQDCPIGLIKFQQSLLRILLYWVDRFVLIPPFSFISNRSVMCVFFPREQSWKGLYIVSISCQVVISTKQSTKKFFHGKVFLV